MTSPTTVLDPPVRAEGDEQLGTLGADTKHTWEQVTLALFIGIPFLAVIAAIPVAWEIGRAHV